MVANKRDGNDLHTLEVGTRSRRCYVQAMLYPYRLQASDESALVSVQGQARATYAPYDMLLIYLLASSIEGTCSTSSYQKGRQM